MDDVKIKEQKKSSLKKKIFFSTLFSCVFLALSFFICTSSFKFNRSYTVDLVETGKPSYKVFLNKDIYYKDDYIESNLSYVTSTIDYILVNYNYLFSLSKETNINYDYKVKSILTITERKDANKILFREEYIEKDIIKNQLNKKTFNIIESVKIDYIKYNKYVNDYKKQYGLSVDADLKVIFEVNTNSKYQKDNIFNQKREIYIDIPLGEQTFSITQSDSINNVKQIYGPIEMVTTYDLLVIGLMLTLLFIIMVYLVFSNISRLKRLKTKYQETIEKILREYDRNIVEIELAKVGTNFDNKILVKSFSELLDARDNIEQPILYIEKIPGKRADFMVINGQTIYIYNIQSGDFNDAKKK